MPITVNQTLGATWRRGLFVKDLAPAAPPTFGVSSLAQYLWQLGDVHRDPPGPRRGWDCL